MIFVEDDSEEMNVILKETGYEDKMRTRQKVRFCKTLFGFTHSHWNISISKSLATWETRWVIDQACGNRFGRADINDCIVEVTGVEIMRWKTQGLDNTH